MSEIFPGFTTDEVAQFQRDGYLVVPGLASRPIVTEMRQATLDDLSRDIAPIEYEADLKYPGAPVSKDAEGGRTARRLKMAIARSPVFIEWLIRSEVLGRLQQLLGPGVICPLAHHNCIMTKQPEYSSDTGWHQDIRYWSFQEPNLVNLWIALNDERPQNGGLWVIPGSHRMSFTPQQFDSAKFFRDDLPQNQPIVATRQPVILAPGDVLFFHCLTLHAASRNQTDESKFSVVFTFRSSHNRPLPHSRSAASPELVLTPNE